MNASRTAKLRGFGNTVLGVLLTLLLFVSALASVNPALHDWLHDDHQSSSDYCLVTALEHGHSDVAGVSLSVVPVAPGIRVSALSGESFFVSHDLTLHPERGPPFRS